MQPELSDHRTSPEYPYISAQALISVMRDEVAIALILVLVIASAGAGYFVGNSARQTTTTTSTSFLSTTITETSTSRGVCGNLTNGPAWVYLMLVAPNSTGTTCLLYGLTVAQQAEFDEVVHQTGSVYSLSDPKNLTLAKGLNITILSILTTASNETIEYSIRTSGNSSGAYTLWVPGTCPGIALVVGLNITSIAIADLNSYYSGNFYCQSLVFIPEPDGVSGMSLLENPDEH